MKIREIIKSSLFWLPVIVFLFFSANVSTLLADAPWPMWRGNLRHTGLSPYDTSNIDGTEEWNFEAGGAIESSVAIGADGTIYFGCHDNKLYALNPDGTEKWRFDAGDPVYNEQWDVWKGILSSPAISSDGTIYFTSLSNYLFAVNSDGVEEWRYPISYNVDIWSSPAIGTDGTIYVGSHDLKMYAINPDGTKKWHFTVQSDTCCSPAVGEDGTIYIGSYDNDGGGPAAAGKLFAINPDGTEKWHFDTELWVESSPAIGSDGTIYFGSAEGNLYAVNSEGVEQWRFQSGPEEMFSSPAIDSDGIIYVASSNKNLHAINPDGTESWRFETENIIESSPVIGADGTIYLSSNGASIYAIDSDGTEKWNFTTEAAVVAAPAIGSNGVIYVGSWDSKLYAIGGTAVATTTTWYLAEGSTSGLDSWVLVQNPNAGSAEITLTYMDQDGNTAVQTETIAGQSRFTQKINNVTNMNNKSGVSTKVECTNDIAIIVERAMYWNDPSGSYWVGGHDSIGITTPGTTWYLAEGSTSGFDTYVLVQNPNASTANITITYMDQDGNTAVQTETITGQSRFTQKINDVPNMNNKSGVSTTVASTNDIGIIVERAMYWNDPSGSYWVGGHDSKGHRQ